MILSRYIIKEHIPPFFFSLAVIMFVFITKFIVQYIGKIFGKGLPFSTILEFIYLNLAWMLALAVPMAVLVAALMAFGRLSADNEITILKTSGISLYQIIRPVLLAALVLTVVMVWYNDRVLPEFNHRARLLFHSISQKKPTLQLEEGIYLTLGNFNILVADIEKSIGNRMIDKSNILGPAYVEEPVDKLKDIVIFDRSTTDLQRTVVAQSGYLVFDKAREQLVFTLFDGEIHEVDTRTYSEYRRLKFTRNVFYIPAPELVFKRREDSWRGDREMTIAMMREEIRKFAEQKQQELAKIEKLQQVNQISEDELESWLRVAAKKSEPISERKRRIAASKAARQVKAMVESMKASQANISYFNKQINKYAVEIHKKFSIPFACIVFVLIGAPLGIRARKGSLGVGITFSVGFFLLYWVCLIGGEELADREIISPFLAMWSPNIIVGLAGVYLTYRTIKETTFIQWQRLPKFLQLFFKGEEEATT